MAHLLLYPSLREEASKAVARRIGRVAISQGQGSTRRNGTNSLKTKKNPPSSMPSCSTTKTRLPALAWPAYVSGHLTEFLIIRICQQGTNEFRDRGGPVCSVALRSGSLPKPSAQCCYRKARGGMEV